MRPIDRGASPVDAGGAPKSYQDYQLARDDLIGRLGSYCSYCEMRVTDGIDVEHVMPKALAPELRASWGNFVLACTPCNSMKSRRQTTARRNGYLWPDRDNTFRAIAYPRSSTPTPAPGLSRGESAAARATIHLVGLDRRLDSRRRADLRLRERLEAFHKAEHALANLRKADSSEMRAVIASLAAATGFFSVWMTMFDDSDMRRRFITNFAGTASDCFDSDGRVIARPGGIL